MEYKSLLKGTLVKRYKRFLADIRLEDGSVITAHCPNSGSMKSCNEPGSEVYISPVKDPNRKTKFTWEMIKIGDGWVGINTHLPNGIVYDWLTEGIIPGFSMYSEFKREVKWQDSRFDIYASNDQEACFIEIKNVTLKEGNYALFPDAVTTRGKKHLDALARAKQEGYRSVILYFVQRSDVSKFSAAEKIDPDYASALTKAKDTGVEVIVVQAKVTPQSILFAGIIE